MPLYGTLRTMPLVDLLGWLGATGKSGTLQVERNRVRKWIVLRDGVIRGAASDDPPEKLGHFLLSQGRISEDQLRIALAAQQETGKHLGRLFVEMGALTDDELRSHLQAKAEETILSLFDGPEAVFRFHEEIQDRDSVELQMPVALAIERGREREDELSRIREAFPDQRTVLRRTSQAPPPEVLATAMARHLYDAVDGQRTLGELLLHVHGSEFLVSRFLFELHRAGFLAVATQEPRMEKPAAEQTRTAPDPGPADAAAAADPLAELELDLGETRPPAPAPEIPQAVSAAAPAAEAECGDATPMPSAAEPPAASPASAFVAQQAAPPAPSAPELAFDLDWDVPDLEIESAGEILDIPEVFAESSDVEAIEDSVAHQVEKKLRRVRELMDAGEYAEPIGILDELYRRYPDDDGLRRLMNEAEAAFKDKAYRHYLPGHMVPRVRMAPAEIESQNLSPGEFFLLSRMDGSWDIRSIIQVAPLREVEALLTLKSLRERGVIELREPQRRRR